MRSSSLTVLTTYDVLASDIYYQAAPCTCASLHVHAACIQVEDVTFTPDNARGVLCATQQTVLVCKSPREVLAHIGNGMDKLGQTNRDFGSKLCFV
jgi:hypothetical protein